MTWLKSKNKKKNSDWDYWENVDTSLTSQLTKEQGFSKMIGDYLYEVTIFEDNKPRIFRTSLTDNGIKPTEATNDDPVEGVKIEFQNGDITDLEIVERKDLKKVRDLLNKGYQPDGSCASEYYKDGLIWLAKRKLVT